MSAATAASPSNPVPVSRARKPYIAGPLYDGFFFIYVPLFALALGIGLRLTPLTHESFALAGTRFSPAELFIASFIAAHLALVFVRSHLNDAVFQRHRFRFLWVPVIVFALARASPWTALSLATLAVWWDVYHSSLQTFGLGRIYDAKRGNDAAVGRRLDYLLNLLLYVGPIVSGASLMAHVAALRSFGPLGAPRVASLPELIVSQRPWFGLVTVALGVPFLAFYVLRYRHYARRGYRVSPQKVALLVSTGACSIYSWGLNSFGHAFFTMNFFHALQYFALVWWTEKDNLAHATRAAGTAFATPAALAFLIVPFALYGVWAATVGPKEPTSFALITTVSLLHFWYDGFIWSVRKGEV